MGALPAGCEGRVGGPRPILPSLRSGPPSLRESTRLAFLLDHVFRSVLYMWTQSACPCTDEIIGFFRRRRKGVVVEATRQGRGEAIGPNAMGRGLNPDVRGRQASVLNFHNRLFRPALPYLIRGADSNRRPVVCCPNLFLCLFCLVPFPRRLGCPSQKKPLISSAYGTP